MRNSSKLFEKTILNIIITGASGFLGSALARRLSGMNYRVSLLVRKNTKLNRLHDICSFKVGVCETDLEIKQFIIDECPDVVIHTACCYGRNAESPLQLIDSNIRFGAVILESIKHLEKKVSFINTGTSLSRDVNIYALTKIQFEEIGTQIANASNHKM
jgi:nucleoside-diphosphate-sugar epimerase